MEAANVIRYGYNTQKQPPAPFVMVTLRHPISGAEVRNLPAQLDTGADCTLLPLAVAQALQLDRISTSTIMGVGGTSETMDVFTVLLGIHTLPVQLIETVGHPNEPWVILGRDVLNNHRILLDGPNLKLELI